jgi:phage terminase large subunit-like protein
MLVRELGDEGLNIFWHGQGYKDMSPPTKELERLILSKEIMFGSEINPIMRWMFKNVVIEVDAAENVKVNRKKRKEKVDGVISLIMAIGCGMKSEGASVYETEKPFFI